MAHQFAIDEADEINIVVTRVSGGTVYARRIRTENEKRLGLPGYPEIRWAELEELDHRPRAGEVISINEDDYADCESLIP